MYDFVSTQKIYIKEQVLRNNSTLGLNNYLKKIKLFTCTVFRPCAIDITETRTNFSLVGKLETRWKSLEDTSTVQSANRSRRHEKRGCIDARSLNRETVLKMDRSRIRSTTGCVLCTVACSTYVRLKIWDTASTRFDSRRLIKHSEASRRYELDATTHACASIITEPVINLNQAERPR